MIKKLLSTLLFTFFYFSATSQIITSNKKDCIQDFSFEANRVSGNNPRVDDILISWDFSKNDATQNLEIFFEVQPLNSCWKGIEGTNRSDSKEYKVTNLSQNKIGKQKLLYSDLYCKCIKWKAKIIDKVTKCETITEWQFTSFL